jgi:acyl carrier protein
MDEHLEPAFFQIICAKCEKHNIVTNAITPETRLSCLHICTIIELVDEVMDHFGFTLDPLGDDLSGIDTFGDFARHLVTHRRLVTDHG